MRRAMAITLAAAAGSLAACGEARSEDAGPETERTYQVGNFDRIQVAGPYDVDVRTGANPGVRAQGAERGIERLVVEVRGSELRIHPQKRGAFNFGWSKAHKVRLTVTVPAIREATIAGSGGIRVDRVQGESFSGQIAGSGDLALGEVEVADLKLGIAGSGEATVRAGRAGRAQFEIAGSGDINAGGVQAETATISIAGSGNVRGNASGSADVRIAGSGDVEITGGARCTISRQGSGNVRCS